MTAEPMTVAEAQTIMAEHECWVGPTGDEYCRACVAFAPVNRIPWPCLPYRLATAYVETQSRIDAALAIEAEWSHVWEAWLVKAEDVGAALAGD